MKFLKKQNKVVAIALVLVFTIAASLAILPASPTTSSSANTSAGYSGANVSATEYNPSDVLQYDWPQWYGSEHWDNYNPGPAPAAADLEWRVRVPGASSGRYYPAAFNGKVFIYSGQRITAVDGITGAIAWNYTYTVNGPVSGTPPSGVARISTGMPYKLDDTHAIAGRVCFNPNDGSMWWYSKWRITAKGVNTTFSTGGGWGGGAGYSDTEKLFFTGGRAWDFSDPSKECTIKWDISNTLFGGESFDAYGPAANGTGVVLLKSGDIARGVEARTGRVLWSTDTTGGFSSYRGTYYNGVFYKGMIDDNFYAWNASTGELLWSFDEGIDYSNFACGSAAAYGMIYMQSGAGILYALDAKTGDVVWKYQGTGWAQYQGNPVVADGKVYQTVPDPAGRDPYTGAYCTPAYVCLDAYTGKLLWRIIGLSPCGAGGESHLIAYGNLFIISSGDTPYVRCYGYAKSDWPMFKHDPQLSGIGQSGPTTLTLRWKSKTGGQVVSSPTIVDDKVYVGSWDKNVYCFDAFTGGLLWKFPTNSPIGYSLAVVNGKVYTGTDDGNVYCLDAATGNQNWKTPVGPFVPANVTNDAGYCTSSPIVTGGKVFVGAVDSKLYCLDATSGSILWSFETVKGEKRNGITNLKTTPCVVGDAVWTTGSPTGPPLGMFGVKANISVYKLRVSDGALLMEIKFPYGASAAPATVSEFSSPLVVGDRLFIPDHQVYWYCFNATTGKQIWRYTQRYTTTIVNTATYLEGRLFVTDGFYTVCLNATSGTLLWQSYMKREVYNSVTFAAFGGSTTPTGNIDRRNYKLYTSNNDNFVHVLNGTTLYFNDTAKDRKLSWYITNSFIISSTSLYKGLAYIGCRDWYVYCFEDYNPVPPLKISIKIATDKTQVNKTKSESVSVSGSIFPVLPIPYENSPTPTSMKITFIKPDSSTVDIPVTVNAQGTFTGTYQPDKAGQWGVVAYVSGDPTANYAESYSNSINLNVVEQTTPSQPTPPPEEAAGTPMEIIYAAIGIVAVVIIVAIAYMWIRKSKKK